MLGNISIWQLVIVLVIIMLLFGTKKLRNIGGDLGGALKSFKKAVGEDEPGSGNDPRRPSAPDATFADTARPEGHSPLSPK